MQWPVARGSGQNGDSFFAKEFAMNTACKKLVLAGIFLMVSWEAARADDWPQWLGPKRNGIWRETDILDKFPEGGPKIRWRIPVDMGYSGPAVAKGKVYVTDRVLFKDAKNPANPFSREKVKGEERILCLNEKDGKEIWKKSYPCDYQISYPSGPRTTPCVADGNVYTLVAMGHLYCWDCETGKELWSKNLPEKFQCNVPMWGYSASPLVDGNKLICLVGGKDHVVVAFDKDSGKELWHALSANEIGYCPPVIFEAGGKRQLIIWHPESVNSLDPETGKVYWTEKLQVKAGMTIPTPRLYKNQLLVTGFYFGSMVLKLDEDKPEEKLEWKKKGRDEYPKNTEALHAVMCTPFVEDGYIYGVCSYGQLRCLKLDTGERIWETLKATGDAKEPEERWGNAFLIRQGDRYFIPNEKGDLIIAKMNPKGYEEISKAHILEPTNKAGLGKLRPVVWSHPAFANRSMYMRNDKEMVCVSLAKE
jgi:outer membrane protein assembly factor BamB